MADATTAKKPAKPAPQEGKKAKAGAPAWPTDPAPKPVEGTPRLLGSMYRGVATK